MAVFGEENRLKTSRPVRYNCYSPFKKKTDNFQRAILLLHGFGSSPAVYRNLIPALSNYDGVVCPALPGHGKSIRDFEHIKSQAWLDETKHICQNLCQEYDKVDIIGISLGGVLACHLSQLFDLNHLFLLAPALFLRSNLVFNLKLARVLKILGMRYLNNRGANLHQQQEYDLSFRKIPLATIIETLTFIQHFDFKVPRCPMDIFIGKYDEVVDSERVALLFNNLPQTKVHWLNHSAHVLPLDGDLATLIDVINSRK